MQRAVQITFRGLEPSEAIEARIRAKAEELERFAQYITGCHVTVELPHRHQHQGRIYSVHVDIRVPGGELVVNRESGREHAHEDVYVAIRDAFNAATRRLEDYVRRRRRDVKQHEPALHGKIRKLFRDDGYGFVELPDGAEIYFHENSVVDATFANLRVGDEVRLVVADGEGEKGPQASTITPIGKHHIVEDTES